MRDLDDLIKIADAKIKEYVNEMEVWEDIRDHLKDLRDNDEVGDQLKYG